MIPVVVIFAPTASGKTALAKDLFGKSSLSAFKGLGEVVSADSQAVYRGMDIGTAKPTKEETEEIPHHLIDLVDPDVQFGLGEFMENADSLCPQIYARNHIPIVVGGTGFYLKNFLLGMPKTPESRPEMRALVKQKLSEQGKEGLYAELKIVDQESAGKINVNDEYRICRALEVYYSCGKPLSSFKMPDTLRAEYSFCTIILNRPKEELYRRIDERVEKMFSLGLEQEVKSLVEKGYSKDSPGMKAIGYSEFFIEGLTLNEIKEKIKNDSHRYAKKQYVFMRGIPGAVTVDADDSNRVLDIVSDFLRDFK